MAPAITKAALAVLLLSLASTSLLSHALDQGVSVEKPLRFGITPVFLVDQAPFLDGWKRYLERHLQRPVDFVRRRSYTEITDMLHSGQLDAAWICSLSYALNRSELQLLATPVYHGEPYYWSYLIVPISDQTTRDYEDLRGKVFAFVEPRSLTGYFYPRYMIRQLGHALDDYFRDTFYTWSHLDSIMAVAEEFAEAASVDGYIWESLAEKDPEIIGRTRVVAKSRRFGFPPVVGAPGLDARLRSDLQKALFNLHEDDGGKCLLSMLHLDRFIQPQADLYDDISSMIRRREREMEN